MNEPNFRRSRLQRAYLLSLCLTQGHSLADHWPHVCARCAFSYASPYEPATVETIMATLEQAAGPWPPI